ncbi:MAG TPA: HDOD domain-containing protein [Spirochaetia bacterium]|nr:HDOD domain-containing protein [Spirochaetia bacterium]
MVDKDTGFEKYLRNMPVMPDIASRILAMADERLEISFKELEGIIKVDAGLSAKILKIANSAIYARQREITSIQMAITLLGFKNIRSLVMLVAASNFGKSARKSAFYQSFWRHSIHSAFMSRHICMRVGLRDDAEIAFIGALLHDIGQVAFYSTDEGRYLEILQEVIYGSRALDAIERDSFGIDHRELGASVFRSWYFPDSLVDIAREHGSSNIVSSHKQLILVVSVADMIADILGLGIAPGNEEALDSYLRYSPVSVEDAKYYLTDYLTDVQSDPLLQQCQELFQIEKIVA